MGYLLKHQLPNAQTVEVGKVSIIDMPLGERVHVVWLKFQDDGTASTGNTGVAALKRMIDLVRVKLNGRTQIEITAERLALLNARFGADYAVRTGGTAGQASYFIYLPIFFAQPWRKGIDPKSGMAESELTAWNIAGVTSFQIEVKWQTVTVAAPKLAGFYEYNEVIGPIGTIAKIESHDFDVAGLDKAIGPIDLSDVIHAMHFFKDSAAALVNKARLEIDGTIVRDDITSEQNEVAQGARGMSHVSADRHSIEFDYDDPFLHSFLASAARKFRLRVFRSAGDAANLPVVIERSGPPN